MHIAGSIPALVTPFQRGGALDLVAFEDLVDWQLQQGSDGLVIGGSTGESGALEETELAALLEIGLRRADGRVPVIAGTGGAATGKALRLLRLAAAVGADAALAVTPFYSRPTQAGMVAHFRALADARWDLAAYDAEVRQSQARRWVVYEALRNGSYYPWDYQPLRAASERYMRNHMDLNVLEDSKRFPRGE